MLTETTGRTAQDLAAELAVLREADWASVWPGPPWGPERELREWCGRQRWEPLAFVRAEPARRVAGSEFLPGVDVRPVANSAAPRGPMAGHGVLNPAAALTLPPPVVQQQPVGVER
ncbi:hypothetical protein [Streptomyces sp. NPDC088254]|uniref:hypothetical protein n=1 Tax=Streptomyces sp. NPDC088254 TaxID=3365847 RepID=UPI00381AC6DB